jgi:hypothetical protein
LRIDSLALAAGPHLEGAEACPDDFLPGNERACHHPHGAPEHLRHDCLGHTTVLGNLPDEFILMHDRSPIRYPNFNGQICRCLANTLAGQHDVTALPGYVPHRNHLRHPRRPSVKRLTPIEPGHHTNRHGEDDTVAEQRYQLPPQRRGHMLD